MNAWSMPMCDTESPQSVVLAALRARDALDFARVAELADPESMARRFEWACEANAPMTLERFARRMPDVPPEQFREKFERYMANAGQRENYISNALVGVHTYD